MVALAHTRAPTLAFARVACAYAGALAAALLLLLLAAPPAGATASSDRPLLSLDRSDISLSDAEWDDLQGTLRQRSDYSPVTLAAGGTDLVNPAPAANDKCGVAASAGDVNGDGRSDVVLGCAEDDSGATDAGTVVVFTRNAANTGFDAAVTLVNPAPAVGDFCGNFVSTTDVNGDGRDDVVMTCVQDDLGAVDAGTVYVFTRNVGNTGFDAAVALANPAPATGDFCGTAAAGGDVNGDGFGDVVVGCPDDDTGAADTGSAVVFLRNATNTGFQAGTTIANPAPAASDACASDLAVGDTNGDGRADIAMGCWADDIGATNAGAVAIFTRNAANSGFDAAVQLANPAPVVNDDCGSAVFGDVNGDGRSDLLMGCTDDDAGANDSGAGYVFTRNAGNTGYDPGVLVVDPTPVAFDRCGFTATLGDINGDGNADVVLGCHWSGPGHVVLIARNATNTGFDAGVEITPTTPVAGDACGNGIATGDFDGDGRSDLLLGCPGDDAGASAAGAAHVRLSINNGVTGTLATTATAEGLPNASPAVSDYCGIWVASGDLNADGRDDVVLGCPNDDTGGTDAGNVTVLLRNAANTGFDPGIELANPTPVASDNCGRSVAVGDFNGDGRGDVAMGCKLDDTGATDTGNVVVYVRNAGNTGFTLAGELVNPAPGVSEWCGVALTAGDVNGDGRDDIVAGCQFESSGIGHEGAMIVFTRNAGNTAFNAGVKIINPTPVLSDYCGLSVTAGDLNADGRDDLIMGCPADDTASANAGNVAVYLRNAGNTGFDPAVELSSAAGVGGDCGFDAAIGDVNGDGRGDVVVGCQYDDSAGTDVGSVLVYTRNAGNTGFDAAVELVNPTPVTNDYCGASVRAADINGDGRADIVMGCRADDTGGADAGNVVLFARNRLNTGFDAGVERSGPSPAAADWCATYLATGDVNGDGRADAIVGCQLDDTGAGNAGNAIVFADRSTVVRSLRLNRQTGTVSSATIGMSRIANGAAAPTLELSANGGVNWESATLGVAHVFATTGTDLRMRLRLPAGSTARSTQVVHDLDVAYVWNAAPNPSPLVTPLDLATVTDTTPDLTATFDDVNVGDTGTVGFEVCTVAMAAGQGCVAAGGSVAASGSSAAGTPIGTNRTYTVAAPLTVEVTYYWHARGTDNLGAVGAWAASRSFTVGATITIGLDAATVALGGVAPGDTRFGTTVASVTSNDPDGYALTATDESNAWAADCVCGGQVPDWTGTDAAPSVWPLLTTGYMGLTVRDVTGTIDNRLAKWGTANAAGWAETDVTNNRYLGVKLGSSATLHQTAAATPGTDTVSMTYRLTPQAAAPVGAYDATISLVALGNP